MAGRGSDRAAGTAARTQAAVNTALGVSAAIRRGALWRMVAGAALISTTSIFVRYAHVAPTVSAFYRVAFGGAMLVVLLAARRQWRDLGWRDAAWLILRA